MWILGVFLLAVTSFVALNALEGMILENRRERLAGMGVSHCAECDQTTADVLVDGVPLCLDCEQLHQRECLP